MVIILIGRKTLKTQMKICQCDYFVGKNLTLVTEVEQKHVCPSVRDQTTACVSCFFEALCTLALEHHTVN